MMKKRAILVSALIFVVLSLGLVSSATFSNQGSNPYFQTSYTAEQRRANFPIIEQMEKGECKERKDVILNVAPFGCKPAVVRSDLLADQDVPVFCQIDALKINPLIQIDQIRNIRFAATDYPDEVSGTGFHPARAALKTGERGNLGNSLLNNIGYVVVVLKRNEIESSLPDFVEVNLTAQIDYEGGNALGVGQAEFNLRKVSDEDWATERYGQSFWNGKYSLRVKEFDENSAVITIYEGDREVTSTSVKKGELSNDIYFPGSYCMASVKARYDGVDLVEDKARIEVSYGDGADVFDVYDNSVFYNDKCEVFDLNLNEHGAGNVRIHCSGEGSFDLELKHALDVGKIVQHAQKNVADKKLVDISQDIIDVYEKAIDEGENPSDALHSFFDGAKWRLYGTSKLNEFLKGYGGNWVDVEFGDEAKKKQFDEAIEGYERVADDYPREKREDIKVNEDGNLIGVEALINAIELSGSEKQFSTRARLINKLIEKYPNSDSAGKYEADSSSRYLLDHSKSTASLVIDNRHVNIRLVSLESPKNPPVASLSIGGRAVPLKEGRGYTVDDKNASFTVKDISDDEIELGYKCDEERDRTIDLEVGETESLCGVPVKLHRVNFDESVKIKLIPTAKKMGSESNINVRIGIEKRVNSLTPERAQQKADDLNETIAKWSSISDKLGESVEGLQTACLATSAFMQFKNFLSGMGGKSLARQKVMGGDDGWREYCEDVVAGNIDGESAISVDKCLLDKSDDIEKDVDATANALKSVNERISGYEKDDSIKSSSLGESIDQDKVKAKLAAYVNKEYGEQSIDLPEGKGDGSTTVSELLNEKNLEDISFNELREIYLNLELRSSDDLSEIGKKNVNSYLQDGAIRVSDSVSKANEAASRQTEAGYVPQARTGTTVGKKNIPMDVVSIGQINSGVAEKLKTGDKVLYSTRLFTAEKGAYYLGLEETSGLYRAVSAVNVRGNYEIQGNVLNESATAALLAKEGIGLIQAETDVSYNNPYENPKVRYYVTEPYKGMPALVPVDERNGWYAATRQTLPTFGGIGAFDASGRVTSFWLGNVGKDRKVNFEESGFGDDMVQLINLNTGQVGRQFPGLDEAETSALIKKAVTAINDAANQFGNKVVRVGGKSYNVGKPSAAVPGTECQDFMSPKDCNLLFNLCDPVVCPPSRCDMGGKYRVPDVIQTGIIGGALLCLPNVKEGIYIPVCLTGIKAGIDNYLSVLKDQQKCYQENAKSGKLVGICDQMHSLYVCNLFWEEIGPLASTLIPKLFESLSGQGKRGGGEYLTVQSAWQNTQNSIDQFTQGYGINVAAAFKAQSLKEIAKSEVCSSYISSEVPDVFDSAIVSPQSPPQITAQFSQTKFSDVTVPATSHYKVYYHIFAGNSQDVHYRVYLKSPPESSYYEIPDVVQVATGYLPAGESADDTPDIKAPEGYREICVDLNGREHCDFKQVSTSFAVNYLRDGYVKDQIEDKNIQSEMDCVSGKRTVDPTLSLGSPQGVLQDIASPQVYNRGVIRTCSTANPALSTDPARWVDVGHCGDPKLICWLDKESVDRAITDHNIGLRNETLQTLEGYARDNLEKETFLTEGDVTAKLETLRGEIQALFKDKSGKDAINVKIDKLKDEVEDLFEESYMNRQKAEVLFLRAVLLEKEYINNYPPKLTEGTDQERDFEGQLADFEDPDEPFLDDERGDPELQSVSFATGYEDAKEGTKDNDLYVTDSEYKRGWDSYVESSWIGLKSEGRHEIIFYSGINDKITAWWDDDNGGPQVQVNPNDNLQGASYLINKFSLRLLEDDSISGSIESWDMDYIYRIVNSKNPVEFTSLLALAGLSSYDGDFSASVKTLSQKLWGTDTAPVIGNSVAPSGYFSAVLETSYDDVFVVWWEDGPKMMVETSYDTNWEYPGRLGPIDQNNMKPLDHDDLEPNDIRYLKQILSAKSPSALTNVILARNLYIDGKRVNDDSDGRAMTKKDVNQKLWGTDTAPEL